MYGRTRVDPTLIISGDLDSIGREEFQRMAVEAGAVIELENTKKSDEEKVSSKQAEETKKYNFEELLKLENFNQDLDMIIRAKDQVIIEAFRKLEEIREQREAEDEANRTRFVPPPLPQAKPKTPEPVEIIKEKKKKEPSELEFLLLERKELKKKLKESRKEYLKTWKSSKKEAVKYLADWFKHNVEFQTNTVAEAMMVPSTDKPIIKGLVESANKMVKTMLNKTKSVWDMFRKQKGAYDVIYNHEKGESKSMFSMLKAAFKVAKVAEDRHSLAFQIRAAGIMREELRVENLQRIKERKAPFKNTLKGAITYANTLPMDGLKQRLYKAGRRALATSIMISYQLKENALKIANYFKKSAERVPQKHQIKPQLQETGSKLTDTVRKGAGLFCKFLSRAASSIKKGLEEAKESAVRFISRSKT